MLWAARIKCPLVPLKRCQPALRHQPQPSRHSGCRHQCTQPTAPPPRCPPTAGGRPTARGAASCQTAHRGGGVQVPHQCHMCRNRTSSRTRDQHVGRYRIQKRSSFPTKHGNRGLAAGSHIGPSVGHEHRAACPWVCGPVPLVVPNGLALGLGAGRGEGEVGCWRQPSLDGQEEVGPPAPLQQTAAALQRSPQAHQPAGTAAAPAPHTLGPYTAARSRSTTSLRCYLVAAPYLAAASPTMKDTSMPGEPSRGLVQSTTKPTSDSVPMACALPAQGAGHGAWRRPAALSAAGEGGSKGRAGWVGTGHALVAHSPVRFCSRHQGVE